jgi:hypothetical protein
MGYRREKSARGLLEVKQAPRAPMPRKTLERREPLAQDDINSPRKGTYAVLSTSASRAGSPRPLDGRIRKKDGAAQAPPRTALLIRGPKPNPRWVRTGASDRRVRDNEGTRIRAVPRARRLEGAPHVVFESRRGQLVGGSHRGRASAPSVPIEWDRAPPSKPTQALPWTCLRTTQPTLIERGMDVHLNHPLAARRGIRNSRPARWELRKPHPPSRGGTARAR